jgi:signal transduction histidine kinase
MGSERIKLDLLIHDLKVPLAVIEAGIVGLLYKQGKYGPLTKKQQKVLERALRNTRVTQRLVNDALELGKSTEGIINKGRFQLSNFIEQSLVELFDLTDHETSESIRECVTLSALKERLLEKSILLNIGEDLWFQEVYLDECKIKQILRNLLNNALKYRKKRVELTVEKEGRCLLITVGDDGEGIPTRYHEKIFECYFQMDMDRDHCVRGHGLGLAGVMVLVEDLGGQLYLDSDVGIGAVFSVKVPMETR